MNKVLTIVFAAALLLTGACANEKEQPQTAAAGILSVEGEQIIDSTGKVMQLRGIAFGNEVWSNKEVPDTHHNEADYARVKAMGMNAIRFYMNYRTFEDDANPYVYKPSGWDWIDRNIAWAKKYGIYLILNMHFPQGGYQSQGYGDALWNEPVNQQRLAALWKAIASRYKNTPEIAGFGLLNEPTPNQSMDQWQQLAALLTTEIRGVDTAHLLFVERANWVKGQNEDENLNFPVLADRKIVYEFHSYEPIQYTHQLFDWSGMGEGGKYPDESEITFSNAQWYTATFNNPALESGTTDWHYFTGDRYTVNDPIIKLAVPALVGAAVGGQVFFDDIEIREFDASGAPARVFDAWSTNSKAAWYYWSANGSGNGDVSNSGGVTDGSCLSIAGATGDCNLTGYAKVIAPVQGYSYQINGWMKGSNVSAAAACKLRIDFLTTDAPLFSRNKAYLEYVIKRYTDWGQARQVPLFLGEFGAGIHCFENNKGGLEWVSDMVDIALLNRLSFTYHTYHEDNFGLYYGYGTLPDPAQANQPLIDLLTQKLSTPVSFAK